MLTLLIVAVVSVLCLVGGIIWLLWLVHTIEKGL